MRLPMFAVATAIALTACQTNREEVAPISPTVYDGLIEWSRLSGAGDFYVSVDGQEYGYSYCDGGLTYDCRPDRISVAREQCEMYGADCVLFAQDGNIPDGIVVSDRKSQ